MAETPGSQTPVIPFFSINDGSASDSALTTARTSPVLTELPPSPKPSTSQQRYTDVSDTSPTRHHSYDDEDPTSLSSQRDSADFYPPVPLKSNIKSREAQFELDSDELPDDLDSSEPLLMEGLLQSGARRGSLDLRRRVKDPEGDEPPDWMARGAGLMAATSNMANSILGAGIIGLPYAFREAGLFMGLVLLVVLGIVTDWTIRLIVLNAKMSGRTTYIDIMDACESGWLLFICI